MPGPKIFFESNALDISARIRARESKLIPALTTKMNYLMQKLADKIANEELSGNVLNRQSGALAASVHPEPTVVEGETVIGSVAAGGGDAWYGVVHQEGGTRTYAINPIGSRQDWAKGQMLGKRALEFVMGGKTYYAAYVFHPPALKRPFMTIGLRDMQVEIAVELRKTIGEVLNS